MAPPLIQLRGVGREFPSGDGVVAALQEIDLTLEPGEMVAIVGASGSGKSTLMNILGCLDRPTAGSYRVGDRDIAELDADGLAELRRSWFGFVFQRYHLLPDLTALANVETPAIYAGAPRARRRARADQLLRRLGLGDRVSHRPSQLSGGQQQRVSIARALMNDAQVIFADEPTGALDSASGEQMIQLLKALNAEGRTIVIVTHDQALAQFCHRIITLHDGRIVDDRRLSPDLSPAPVQTLEPEGAVAAAGWRAGLDGLGEALAVALMAMRSHGLRTLLTMLGIIIGISSVVSVVALGEGSRRKVLADISAMGTNTIDVRPGRSFGDPKASTIRTLVVADAAALATHPAVDSVTPSVQASATFRSRSLESTGQVSGVGEQYFRVKGLSLAQGRAFDAADVQHYAQAAVIDANTQTALFASGSAIGQVFLVNAVPVRVVGVLSAQRGGFGMGGDTLTVYLPYTTVQARMLGNLSVAGLTVRVRDEVSSSAAEDAVTATLVKRHRAKDFFVINSDQIRQTITSTTQTLTLLISAIAVISLVVGGIGVMNIMLVSVSERTSEIGVRMAVGARQADILRQFLAEAVLVCLIGGLLGVLLALGLGALLKVLHAPFTMVYSTASILAAFGCSTLIGIVFGYLPARNAARLDPVVALARD